jgi:SAM-dependent methyltransferase
VGAVPPDYTRRFSNRADWYASYRPGYPRRVIAILEKEIGFGPRHVVADIGSGTGLLTRIFLENGNRVFGIEPNASMRSHAERDLGGFRNFVSVAGTAERTTLPSKSIDLVAAGQALHWFDPARSAREFSRISKRGGALCVAYNSRKDDRVGRAYGEIISTYARDRAKVPDADAKYIARFFKGGESSKFELPNEQSLDLEGLMGRLLSASYMPPPGEGREYSKLRADVTRMFDKFSSDGRLRLRYRTNIFVGTIA